MHPSISAHLSEWLIDRRGGHRHAVIGLLADRMQHDYFDRTLLQEKRNQAVADLLNHARAHVPFYRERLAAEAEITPDRALQVLHRLPVLRRADIQAAPAQHLADDAQDVRDDFTGGSTGTPLAFKVDRATQQAREASLMWANTLAGWQYGERVAMLWGSDRDVASARRDWRLQFRWWIDNMRWFNAFDMGEVEMERFHIGLTHFQPHLLVAYAGSLFTFARFLEARNIRPSYPDLGMVSSAEVLSAPMRETIERVFGRSVYDRYGNREAGAIAAECEAHAGLHVNEADFVVEIDSRDPYKTPGPLYITYLRNRAMPLIRYDTGDLGLWAPNEPCECGRRTGRLVRIVGRQSDTIRTANGKLIHGEYFTHVLYGASGVREFQFVQESLQQYRLLLAGDRAPPEQQEQWRRKILAALGPGSELAIEYVDRIPALPSGKRRFTVTKVPDAAAGQGPREG